MRQHYLELNFVTVISDPIVSNYVFAQSVKIGAAASTCKRSSAPRRLQRCAAQLLPSPAREKHLAHRCIAAQSTARRGVIVSRLAHAADVSRTIYSRILRDRYRIMMYDTECRGPILSRAARGPSQERSPRAITSMSRAPNRRPLSRRRCRRRDLSFVLIIGVAADKDERRRARRTKTGDTRCTCLSPRKQGARAAAGALSRRTRNSWLMSPTTHLYKRTRRARAHARNIKYQ